MTKQERQRAMLLGWPWDGMDHDTALEKCWACHDDGLLDLVKCTEWQDREEFGESKFVLSDAGRAARARMEGK